MKSGSSPALARVEGLEARTLLSATVVGTPVIVNTSKLVGPQADESIAINPANPNEAFVVSDNDQKSIFAARSTDGGSTWAGRVMLNGADGLPQAFGDPTVAFDHFGNLFLSYETSNNRSVEVLLSFDGGQTFHLIGTMPTSNGRPIVATQADRVWVAFRQQPLTGAPASLGSGGAVAYEANIYGLGRVKSFRPELIAPVQATVEGLAVGPAGQVAAAYVYSGESGPTQIYTATDAGGAGSHRFVITQSQIITQVGFGEQIPAQTGISGLPVIGIEPATSLAYDLSSDPFTGRLYMAYTDAPTATSANTNIILRYSDNDGTTWSGPIKVNDDLSGKSHFNPHVAVDPLTGTVAVTWYDARNDNGIQGTGGTDAISNDDVQVYGAVGSPTATGVTFTPNFIIQPAFSNSNDVLTSSDVLASTIQLGSYNGLAFYNGQLLSSWADNSNSTGDNGDGPLAQPDVYVGKATIQTSNMPVGGALIGSFGDSAGQFTYAAPSGGKLHFHLHRGQGYVFLNGSTLSVRVNGTDARSALNINGSGRGNVSLGSVYVSGPMRSIQAPRTDLAGVFSVQGNVTRVTLGTVSGGTFAATGSIGRMRVQGLTNARVLSGANPGVDLAFAGPSDTDDAFATGSIDSLIVTGAIQGSVVGAGVNPVDGIFGNGNDVVLGGSRIGTLRARSADAASRFEASVFSKVLLPGPVTPASDPRFVTV